MTLFHWAYHKLACLGSQLSAAKSAMVLVLRALFCVLLLNAPVAYATSTPAAVHLPEASAAVASEASARPKLPTPTFGSKPIPSPAPAVMPSPFGSLLQVIMGLGLVLAMIIGGAWAFRRFSGGMLGVPQYLRVVSGVMVGSKERVVIVEVAGDWLVLGVTAQQVNLLSKLPKPTEIPEAVPQAGMPPFASWLKAALAQRSANQRVKK